MNNSIFHDDSFLFELIFGRVDLRAQLLVQHGYFVFRCDNRGSARRGLKFEGAIKWDMGRVELEDQCVGLRYFARKGLVDLSNVSLIILHDLIIILHMFVHFFITDRKEIDSVLMLYSVVKYIL